MYIMNTFIKKSISERNLRSLKLSGETKKIPTFENIHQEKLYKVHPRFKGFWDENGKGEKKGGGSEKVDEEDVQLVITNTPQIFGHHKQHHKLDRDHDKKIHIPNYLNHYPKFHYQPQRSVIQPIVFGHHFPHGRGKSQETGGGTLTDKKIIGQNTPRHGIPSYTYRLQTDGHSHGETSPYVYRLQTNDHSNYAPSSYIVRPNYNSEVYTQELGNHGGIFNVHQHDLDKIKGVDYGFASGGYHPHHYTDDFVIHKKPNPVLTQVFVNSPKKEESTFKSISDSFKYMYDGISKIGDDISKKLKKGVEDVYDYYTVDDHGYYTDDHDHYFYPINEKSKGSKSKGSKKGGSEATNHVNEKDIQAVYLNTYPIYYGHKPHDHSYGNFFDDTHDFY